MKNNVLLEEYIKILINEISPTAKTADPIAGILNPFIALYKSTTSDLKIIGTNLFFSVANAFGSKEKEKIAIRKKQEEDIIKSIIENNEKYRTLSHGNDRIKTTIAMLEPTGYLHFLLGKQAFNSLKELSDVILKVFPVNDKVALQEVLDFVDAQLDGMTLSDKEKDELIKFKRNIAKRISDIDKKDQEEEETSTAEKDKEGEKDKTKNESDNSTLLFETDDESSIVDKIGKFILDNTKISRIINSDPGLLDPKEKILALYKDKINDYESTIKMIKNFKTLDDVASYIGKKIDKSKVPEGSEEEVKKEIFSAALNGAKKSFITDLINDRQKLVKGGLSTGHPLINMLDKGATKIKDM